MRLKLASLLHGSFRTGITLKGIGGLTETIGGILLWFITPAELSAIVSGLLEEEHLKHPHNFIASHFLHMAGGISHADPVFASLYLLSHGVVKTVLIVALWFNKLWAYPLTIAVFGAFMVYQVYRYTYTHSFALMALTIFDAAVVWLTWHEYRAQAAVRSRAALGAEASAEAMD
jgi:uncharacterized membrane protein